MIVLALDTTTPEGSQALWRDGETLALTRGDTSLSHGTRQPTALLALVQAAGLSLADVDLFAVAAGPGSLTGLRVGIATIQGLAFATRRPVVAVSTLDALAAAAARPPGAPAAGSPIAAVMHAHRGEVFTLLVESVEPGWAPEGVRLARDGDVALAVLEEGWVGAPEEAAARWATAHPRRTITAIGDGADLYRGLFTTALGRRWQSLAVPPLADVIACIAAERAEAGQAIAPHAIRPVYVRRPDAEVARDRRAAPPDPVDPR